MNTTLSNTIKKIDTIFFKGNLIKLNRKRWKNKIYKAGKQYVTKMQKIFKYNNNICFTSKNQNDLGMLFDKYGSDKGYSVYEKNKDYLVKYPAGHCYNDVYQLLFCQHKKQTKLVLECGIGSKNSKIPNNMSLYKYCIPGGSLQAWKDYFPNAQIIGIDIDPDVMFTEDRISTYVCDQTSKQSINNFISQAELKPNTVDIIIDDGLHEFIANITLFENTNNLLKENGIYVIEDFRVDNEEQQKFIDYFSRIENYSVVFIRIIGAYLIVITKKTCN